MSDEAQVDWAREYVRRDIEIFLAFKRLKEKEDLTEKNRIAQEQFEKLNKTVKLLNK